MLFEATPGNYVQQVTHRNGGHSVYASRVGEYVLVLDLEQTQPYPNENTKLIYILTKNNLIIFFYYKMLFCATAIHSDDDYSDVYVWFFVLFINNSHLLLLCLFVKIHPKRLR